MSEDAKPKDDQRDETGAVGEVGDEQLPEDLRPDEDNPLGRHPGETGDSDDAIGEDREGEAQTAPLKESEADYAETGD